MSPRALKRSTLPARSDADAEFDRICREEEEAGETVVVATEPARCTGSFPCLAHIFVLAGLEQPCPACAPRIQQMRDLHGYRQEGKFWICDHLTPGQRDAIRHRIGQADARNWEHSPESEHS